MYSIFILNFGHSNWTIQMQQSSWFAKLCKIRVAAFQKEVQTRNPPPPPVNARGPFYWNGITLIPAWLSNYIRYKDRGWNYISIPQLQQLHRWNLEMNKRFHPTLFWACNYLSMQRCKLIHVSKRDPSSHLLCKLKDGASVVMEL